MPRRKKKATELTKDEAMKKLFPKKVREQLHETAHAKDKPGKESQSEPSS